jgi:hypothetical protein
MNKNTNMAWDGFPVANPTPVTPKTIISLISTLYQGEAKKKII